LSFVLDASVALAWCFEDERTPDAMELLRRLAETGAVAPMIWPLEVSNVLLVAERRKRLAVGQAGRLAGFLRQLPITLDRDTADHAWDATRSLAAQHRLTSYDAAYLELALRRRLLLASTDRELRHAAAEMNVPLLGAA
jgi:predicted nucleic acid-binding protein